MRFYWCFFFTKLL